MARLIVRMLAKECRVGGGDPTRHRDPVGRVGHAALEAVLVPGDKPYTSSNLHAINIHFAVLISYRKENI
jgi:hypothetical protein